MPEQPAPSRDSECPAAPAEWATPSLFYRFLFFDWLFADMSKACTLFERRAAWQHNRSMRVHLAVYLRRWAFLAFFGFALGCVFEQVLEAAILAACCFTGSCMALPVITVIGVAWIFLSRPQMP